MGISLAVVGATGVVGLKFLEVLQEQNIEIDNLVLFASDKSAGRIIAFKRGNYRVFALSEDAVRAHPVNYALFSAGASVSLQYAPLFASLGTIVIDNSSAFRMDENVPLVVPEVNPDDVKRHSNIIANPNCSTIQAVVALKPLHDAFTLKRVVVSTYQAVSGAGQKGIADLLERTTSKFPYPINENVLPHIDVFLENGYTKEEEKMINETRKIMHLPSLNITATAVRVPVLNGHSESINVEFERPCGNIDLVKSLLAQHEGIIVYDDVKNLLYPMPIVANEQDKVYVGRLRKDYSVPSGINMFVVADNIRKGAATNAIQILKLLIAS
jgi:aspartate-semialdehyde dehydrogenase